MVIIKTDGIVIEDAHQQAAGLVFEAQADGRFRVLKHVYGIDQITVSKAVMLEMVSAYLSKAIPAQTVYGADE
jgi:hypothetical protein